MSKVFCEECRKFVEYDVFEELVTVTLKNTEIRYKEKYAKCKECGCDIFVEELNDLNLRAVNDKYREINDIMSLAKVIEIPEMYNIGKRPLSLLLGWGEQTYTRYCDDYIPLPQYSDLLKKIYNNPYEYLLILEKNKDKISNITYKRSKKATEELLYKDSILIDDVSNYILKSTEITPLALQKALYYVQGFYAAFFGGFMFKENCEAWVHGPVYRGLYNKYSKFEYRNIETLEKSNAKFTDEQKTIIDSVIEHFCCYSGKVLENFTHKEKPWQKAREGLNDLEPSNNEIEKLEIMKYFKEVKEKYKIVKPCDISLYSERMFELLKQ